MSVSKRLNIFIDIDGVLLGKSPETKRPALANYAKEFIEFSLPRRIFLGDRPLLSGALSPC